MQFFQLFSVIYLALHASAVPMAESVESKNLTNREVNGFLGCKVHIQQNKRVNGWLDVFKMTLSYGPHTDPNVPTCIGQLSYLSPVYCQGMLHSPVVCTRSGDHEFKCCASRGGYCFGSEIGGCSVGDWAEDSELETYWGEAGQQARQLDCGFAC